MVVYHIWASIDVQIKVMASNPLWRTMEPVYRSVIWFVRFGETRVLGFCGFSQGLHMNYVLYASTNISPR